MRVYLSELALFLLISNKGVPFLFIFIPAPSTLFSVKEKKNLTKPAGTQESLHKYL